MSSLDRLIDLAKQTNSRLIVHDPIEGRDLVIMETDDYEELFSGKKSWRREIRGMSGEQMLDQINRDIAAWRANREEDRNWERNFMLEDELSSQSAFDPLADRGDDDDWQRAGEVMEKRYDGEFWRMENDDWQPEDGLEIEELADVSFREDGGERPVPYSAEELAGEWQTEPLPEEEPIFYEEPV